MAIEEHTFELKIGPPNVDVQGLQPPPMTIPGNCSPAAESISQKPEAIAPLQ